MDPDGAGDADDAIERLLDAVRLALEPHLARLQARGESWQLSRHWKRYSDGRVYGTVSILGRPMPADDREIEAVLSVARNRPSGPWNRRCDDGDAT